MKLDAMERELLAYRERWPLHEYLPPQSEAAKIDVVLALIAAAKRRKRRKRQRRAA